MNRINKKNLLLVLSCAMLATTVGYATWIIPSHNEFVINNEDTKTKPIAYIVGNEKIKFTTIEKALDYANDGDIVCVIPPTSGTATYRITRDCVVKEGVTLVLPTSEESFTSVKNQSTLNEYIKGMIEVPDGPGTTSKATEKNLKTVVTVDKNIKIENNGNIVVSGILTGGNNNAGSIGQTAGDYSKIVLSSGAQIIQAESDSANLYCFGFIDEESNNNGSGITLEKGNAYIPFVVIDYRGFGYSYALSQNGGISNYGCSPFNRYEFPNVSSLLTVSSTGQVKAIVNILVTFSSAGVTDSVSHETLNMVGKASDSFICLLENSILKYKYNKETSNADIEIIDGCKVGNLAFKATVGGFSADMNTSSGYFPVSYNFSIKLSSSNESNRAAFDSSMQKLKFLPGSSVDIGANCDLTLAETAVYSAFVDGIVGNGKEYSHGANSMAYPIKPGAVFKIDSSSSINAKAFGGTIYSDTSSNLNFTSTSTICNEPWAIGGGLVPSFTEYLEIREKANIVPRSYLSMKKAYFFSNLFKKHNDLLPKTQVFINQELSETVEGKQSVLFADEIDNYQLVFERNVYNALYLSDISAAEIATYPYKAEIQGTNNDILIGVINSTIAISSSDNGINEFEVQDITISSAQDKVDGKDPLYLGKTLGLKANLVDSSKIYNPTITWRTSDTSIATVDSSGLVTGVKLGKVTVYAECGGKTASYETEVISDQATVDISNMWLESGNGKKSNDFKGTDNTVGSANNGSADFKYHEKVSKKNSTAEVSFKVEPENATITGLKWEYVAWGQKSYMTASTTSDKKIYVKLDGYIGGENDTTTKSVSIIFEGDTGYSPDSETVTCTVYYGDGKEYTLTFVFDYDTGCILPTARVLMADGTYREAMSITTGDMVISFNHETGKFEPTRVLFNDHADKPAEMYDVLHLEFDNGKSTDLIYEHGYFDLDENKYVYIRLDNYSDYIGHRFVFVDNELNRTYGKLVKANIVRTFTKLASIGTANHINAVVDDMLSMAGALKGLFNIFEYDPNTLAFDKDKMQRDIDKYGLLDYEYFKDYFPKEIYDLLPCKYLGVSIGKGLITWDIIKSYIAKWKDQLMKNMK